jgi:hypothetical protein
VETKPQVEGSKHLAGELIPAERKGQYPTPTKATLGERAFDTSEALICLFANLFLLPFRLLWDLIVIGGALTLTVLWLGFVFGSVVGVVLLLIFMPEGFLLPMALLALVIPLWKECE